MILTNTVQRAIGCPGIGDRVIYFSVGNESTVSIATSEEHFAVGKQSDCMAITPQLDAMDRRPSCESRIVNFGVGHIGGLGGEAAGIKGLAIGEEGCSGAIVGLIQWAGGRPFARRGFECFGEGQRKAEVLLTSHDEN